jgi:hypothetical protein
MKLKSLSIRLLVCASLLVLGAPRLHASPLDLAKDKESNLYKAYKWFCAVQNPTGLVSTREGTEGICFVYDQALAVFVYLLFDDVPRAQKTLDFFVENYKQQLTVGRFIGFADMYLATGSRGAYHFAVGPNAWLLTAINYYTEKTKDKKYLELGRAIADWMMWMEGIEGGLTGGMEEDFYWMSTEHNVDAFSALRDFTTLTGEKKYRHMARKIKEWLDKCTWVEEEKHFTNGRYDPNFATDVATWPIMSLGKEYGVSLDFVKKVAHCKHYYKFKDIEVEGVDFGSTYEKSPLPDKDAVWFEGTGQMALACYQVGRDEEGDFYTGELERALTDSPIHPGTMGLPYASNPGTPPYGGWQMQDEPLCVSSTAWYIYAKLKFNPFTITGTAEGLEEANKDVQAVNIDTNKMFYFTPVVDNFEYEMPKFITGYLANKIRKKDCVFTRVLEFNKAQEGLHSMRLLFIPKRDEKKMTKKEIDKMVAGEIQTTSSQKKARPLVLTDEVELPGAQQPSSVLPAPEFINAEGFTTRLFMLPQDWSKFSTFRFWVNTDNSSNMMFVRIVDEEGNISESRLIPLEGKGWKPQVLYFNTPDFSVVKRKGNDPNATTDLSKVKKFMIGIKSRPPLMDSIVWVDDIRLE